MGIDPKVIADVMGRGIIHGPRESGSSKGHSAWFAVNSMLNEEWNMVCEAVAEEVVKIIGAHEVDNSFMDQMRKLKYSIDNLAEVIEITFGHRNKSISEILKGELGLRNSQNKKL